VNMNVTVPAGSSGTRQAYGEYDRGTSSVERSMQSMRAARLVAWS